MMSTFCSLRSKSPPSNHRGHDPRLLEPLNPPASNRAFNLSFSWELYHQEIEHLSEFCYFNLFPRDFIHSLTKSFLDKIYHPPLSPSSPNNTPTPFYIKIPFLGPHYSQLSKVLYSTLSRHLPHHRVFE